MRLLHAAGARANCRDVRGMQPIHYIGGCHQTYEHIKEKVRLLVQWGADINQLDSEQKAPLEYCFLENNLPGIQCLLEAGASLSARDYCARTYLHKALVCCDIDSLEYLAGLQGAGIDYRTRDCDGSDPWDALIWSLHYPTNFGGAGLLRESGVQRFRACERLYRSVRDRCLYGERQTLKQAYALIERRRAAASIDVLQTMVDWFRPPGLEVELETHRTIQLQIREEMWEAANEAVEERLEMLDEELATSPWARPHPLWELKDRAREVFREWYPDYSEEAREELARNFEMVWEARGVMLSEWEHAGTDRNDAKTDYEWETTDEETDEDEDEEAVLPERRGSAGTVESEQNAPATD